MSVPTIAAWLLAIPVTLVTTVFLTEVAAGLAPYRSRARLDLATPARTTILIPAHDEEIGIGAMLERLLAGIGPHMRALVVADNCTDRTAEIARRAGAEVINRNDADRRGKGYALAFGRDHRRATPPECVIVLDADCDASGDALDRLAWTATTRDRPVQANYLFRPNTTAPAMVQVSSFALAVKNNVRQLGLSRLGAPALLTGTGMAFPWSVFESAPLATDNLVEDLALGIDLLEAGHPPLFLPAATVWSAASNAAGTLSQRSRWEGGFIATARRHALPLIAGGLTRLSWKRFWLGLHLAVPPLALLLAINLVTSCLLALLVLAGANAMPLLLSAVLLLALGLAVAGAWWRIGRPYLSPSAALRLPLYFLWKIPIYLKMLRGGEKRWVRTEREP
jgi:cellulose synthase/poly-beta-1,6-N-acetylglucosamine synthase-like glycosyltransferase